ncbi:MAG: efflux RND transporter periplasmic adaptor subunit [Muribaculum sp.]|nr:efflux RND transporter periplasmic adaptor subunit [Muribaculum sp.]
MKIHAKPILIITLMSALSASIFTCCKHNDKDRQQTAPEIDVAYPTIDSIVLHHTYPGQVYTQDEAQVVARVNGLILRQHYTDGQRVNAGQVLFTIESAKYADLVRTAESNLATARSEYEYASRNYEAMKKAVKTDAVSQMDVAQSKSNFDQAAQAIKSAEAALQTARTNLGYCQVKAPISGIASAAVLDEGAYVGGEGSPVVLTTIYDDRNMGVQFHVSDREYQQIMDNSGGIKNPMFRKVPITFNPPVGRDYTIDLSYESPSVDSSTGTLLVQSRISDNNGSILKDGMYCTVNLPYGTSPHALLIKDASIATDQRGKYVYVVNDSNKVVYTPIEVGELYQDSLRVVTKGLTSKQRYVTKALLQVRDGEKVKPRLSK